MQYIPIKKFSEHEPASFFYLTSNVNLYNKVVRNMGNIVQCFLKLWMNFKTGYIKDKLIKFKKNKNGLWNIIFLIM